MAKSIKSSICGVVLFFVLTATVIAAHGQVFNDLVIFNGTDGATPVYPGLVEGIDGNLYGTTLGGGAFSAGTVFKITPKGTLTTLYSFCSQANCSDGTNPQAGLTFATNGNFYGSTMQGGANGDGTIFEVTSKGVLTTLHSFDSLDGAFPFDPPIQASDGNFYGTTNSGGLNNGGTVFKMTPDGVLSTLYSFGGVGNGYFPLGTLVQATDGALYGTTEAGGSGGCEGTVFRITTAGDFTLLHSFNCTDGSSPSSGLIQATNGELYGTTYDGGSNNACNNGCGTLFSITLKGALTTLFNFDSTHGSNPISSLVQGSDNNLYGTTYSGGTSGGWGTIFESTTKGTLQTLHSFDLNDGAQPYGALVQATTGNFYGTTPNGGNNYGTVFGVSNGLKPFVALVHNPARVGQMFGILGQGLVGTTGVSLNGTPVKFTVKSGTLILATVPPGATTGYVTVTTPTGVLTSNVPFRVIP